MLNTKTAPNQQLIEMMRDNGMTERSMIEVITNPHALWLSQNSGGGIYFSTRISDDESWNQVQQWEKEGKMKDMYMVEVIAGKDTPQDRAAAKKWVGLVNQQKMVSELDAMSYQAKEARDSGCDVPLKEMESILTMTSRPKSCINRHGNKNVFPAE